MKKLKFWRILTFAAVMTGFAATAHSCKDKEKDPTTDYGTVTGTVTNEAGTAIEGVTVAVSGIEATATTNADGNYSISSVSIDKHTITFSKTGWQTTTVSIAASKFVNKTATVNATLGNASAKLTVTVLDGMNGGNKLPGVTVTIAAISATKTTDANGVALFEDISVDDYAVALSKEGYSTLTRQVVKADFVAGEATLNVTMGSAELLPGLTADDLRNADKWYYNEYRGGGNGDAYPHWDWACDYFCSMTFVGGFEEQWEGSTLRIRNNADEKSNPANLDVFDSFTYGSKKITADNKIFSLRVRTHDADEASPAHFGVQVIDLLAAEPTAVKVGENRTHGSNNYADYHFDLSEYVGKEVIIAVGIYRAQTGDYWKQLCLRALRFAHTEVTDWNWLPGEEVISGWKLSKETVRSTMPNAKKHFTGISPFPAGREVNLNLTNPYPIAYKSWREVSHIGHEWSFVPLNKDPEVTPSEGYLIKTRGNTPVNLDEPEAYLYFKTSVAAGKNQLSLKTRTFGSNFSFFKITAIKDDGTYVHLSPASNNALEAEQAESGCWKFRHERGGADVPDEYATFTYDLSSYNGSDVTLVFGIYKGETNGDENKLLFYSVDLN